MNISPVQLRLAVFGGLVLLIGLTILQDYLYADLKRTGFYWTESLLYNTFWLYFIPIIYVLNRLKVFPTTMKPLLLFFYALLTAIAGSLIHLMLFTAIFILTSQLFFDPPHRFSAIFATALSNQLYLTFAIYALVLPLRYYQTVRNTTGQEDKYPDHFLLRSGNSQLVVPTSAIVSITTDRPYSLIRTVDQKFFHDVSLSRLQEQLNPSHFIRVHRSAIIRKEAVISLTSRKNGDYDATLTDGQIIRFSRHYRPAWEALLH